MHLTLVRVRVDLGLRTHLLVFLDLEGGHTLICGEVLLILIAARRVDRVVLYSDTLLPERSCQFIAAMHESYTQ